MKKFVTYLAMSAAVMGGASQIGTVQADAAEGEADLPFPDERMLNISHRGASGYAPEHTIAAYELGVEKKGDYIEVDLQMTKDGELIAMHDETVDRTTDGTGRVGEMTLEEIKQLDAGTWFNEQNPEMAKPEYAGLEVPTLREIFEHFGKSKHYYIETKSPDVYPGMEEKLNELLEEYKLTGVNGRSSNVIIQSFSQESLLKMNEINPDLPLVQLISRPDQEGTSRLDEIAEYAIGVGPSFSRIKQMEGGADYISKVREKGLLIHPYTVNTEEDMLLAMQWGITGVFTNYPDRFRQMLKDYNH
ncbi:glycerophosphodiester phosphodiesterase [Virgibacillus senegalensis]|uniref:glycerophosphodiester phosphodiesterase n=1 Tax=Virgibacillus senegalensis TaxID=1499679 RepID=UPI00069FBE73|nr:glycerophosphodiester phosphodiesterase [Virgibacillus senegalensis]